MGVTPVIRRTATCMSETIDQKYQRLLAQFAPFRRVLVAYSGGVDSTLVLKAATDALGAENAIGVTARSETLTDEEYELTARIAREHGFNHQAVQYSELEIENYAENPSNRCYYCKSALYENLAPLAERFGVDAVCNGDNLDDVGDYRPGMVAANEANVVSPLKSAELRKSDVRALALHLGLPNHDKPASPCLSSRIPYGQTITREKLDAVGQGERLLRALGFRQCRVRHHGEIARIEIDPAEMHHALNPETRDALVSGMKGLGFKFVALDLQGYRMGSLNEVLK